MHTITLTGQNTLLTKNVQLGDPDNQYVREIGRLNALKAKITDDQRAEREFLQWRGGLYWDDIDGPILPASNLFRSIQQAGALTRNGKDVERALVMHDVQARLEFPGKRDIDSLWGKGKSMHVDRRMAKINRAPVVSVRPAFPQWTCAFRFDLDEDIMSLEDFTWVAEKAGRLIHIGDYRRFFGSYAVVIETLA